ncbi:nucleoside hydrolase-like domain-containing protein [Pedobacter sp.]|uniref:DUF1593 domain-containing protein n=1 Tax=Pedobacter sp. TaxID=1411316 RepID=UPI003C31DAC1
MNKTIKIIKNLLMLLLVVSNANFASAQGKAQKPRVFILSDGEIDDECSMVRCLLYANDFEIEGIITTSSQYHWQGHKWAGDGWMAPYLDAYQQVYPNLIKHDAAYPKPDYLRERTVLGNVKIEGEMDDVTAGSQLIVKVLLDQSDSRPIWMQAWGGTNTLARALKSIEKEHPERMEEVAKKMRFFFIWEQDSTYQSYIKPHWGKYNILTIISDQFEAIAYRWKNTQPKEMYQYYRADWMKKNILENRGPLSSLYKAHKIGDEGFEEGDFRSEGDSPAFMHQINTGLRNLENPDWGGWGGRYVKVRGNTWLDPVPDKGYAYPEGRWWGNNGWGRMSSKRGNTAETDSMHRKYFEPIWRWSPAFQNDFAARAAWCVKSYAGANHHPIVKLENALAISAKPGEKIKLSAKGTLDPDGDQLSYSWWEYQDADSNHDVVRLKGNFKQKAYFIVPSEAKAGNTIHIICEVSDNGTPKLTRYQRVVLTIQ